MIAQAETSTQLSGRWLPIARTAWVILVTIMLGFWLVGTIRLIREPLPDCIQVPCDPVDLNAGDLEVAEDLNLPTGFLGGTFSYLATIIMGVSYFAIAGLIFWRKSDDWMGLLLSFMLVYLGGIFFTSSNDALQRAYPDAELPLEVISALGTLSIFVLFFVFPDGRFVPRRLKWLALVLLVGALFIGYLPLSKAFIEQFYSLWFLALLIFAISAQLFRYFRVSTPTDRQQTKWVMLGLMGSIALVLAWLTLSAIYPADQPSAGRVYALLVAAPLILFFSLLLPITLALSIFRYRLWDIDIVIQRTLVYGLLTLLLLLIYFGSVILLQSIFAAVSGQRSAVAIVISTLLIAALFAPLRRRIQGFIDRRFYRRKYDAAQTLAQFGHFVRDETDLEALTAELTHVVKDTMQPEQANIWLKEVNR